MNIGYEEQIKKNKMDFYSFVVIGLFVCVFGIIGSIFLIRDNFPFYGGYIIMITCLIVTIVLLNSLYYKPDFKPRTLRKVQIPNKSLNKIKVDIETWFKKNDFNMMKLDSNNIIGSKIINHRVKYIFNINIKENEEIITLHGVFSVLFDYNSNKSSESSLSNNRISGGSIYKRPAWFLMEDLIKNIQ
jgi:hypothetical protein